MFLRWALASHPHLTFAVLGDNLHVITVLSPSTPPGLPSRSPASTWGSSLQSIQASLRPGMIQGWGWIKGHARFVGNEISDAYSKWAAHVRIWDPSLLPPPPDRVHIQRPPPRHTQTDYHLNQAPPPSAHTRKHPRTVQLPFLKPHFMVQRPPFQMVLRKLQHGAACFPRRLAPSPLPRLPRPEPNGCYLFRLTLPNVRPPGANLHSMLAPPLHHSGVPMVVRDHTRRGEAQFLRGLVPMSLYTKLTTPPSGRRKPAHCHDLKLALMAHVPLLLNALYHTLEWLNDHPPPAPLTPPTGSNSWGRPWSPYSTSHTAQQAPPPSRLPPPPPPGQSCTQASKAPPSPILCRTHQNSKTRPPAPKACPAPIAETQYRKPTSARAAARQTAAHNPAHVQPPPPPSTSTPPRRLRPHFRPFSPHNKVLRTSPPIPREHKLTIVLNFVRHVISLKKPHLHASLDSPNTAQPLSTTTLALTSHFCK